MAKMREVATVLILLGGCTAMQAPPAASGHRLPADSISFDLNSWGNPVEGFRIASDGSGEYRLAPRFGAAPEVRRFNSGPAGFERMRTVLAGIEHFTARAPVCGDRATDLPYGDIVWQHGTARAGISLDVGCQGPEMQQVATAAHTAADLAAEFARTNPAP